MANLTFSFNTGNITTAKIIDAICLDKGYQATLIDGTPNPETKAVFAKKVVGNFIKEMVFNQDRVAAINSATAGITPVDLT